MMPYSRNTRFRWVLVIAGLGFVAPAVAGPINSNVAFTPRQGGSILRLQYRYTEAQGDSGRHVNTSAAIATYVYGLTPKLALFLNVPYMSREIHRFNKRLGHVSDTGAGFGDVSVLAKYRFHQEDIGPGRTIRWAVIGGLNIRTGDSDFTSDSYDPILGTVWSWRHYRHRFDADLLYQFNTGGGAQQHDLVRVDAAYSFRVYPAQLDQSATYEIDTVAEFNGEYRTDGSHEIFLSPGIQLTTAQWTLESSVQVPVSQNLARGQPEADYRFVIGMRFRW